MDVPRVGKWYPVAISPPVVPTDVDKYAKYVEAYHLYFRQCESYGSKHKEMLFARDLRQSYGVSVKPRVKAKRDDKGNIIEAAKPPEVVPDNRRSELRALAKATQKGKGVASGEKPARKKRKKSAAAKERRRLRKLERRVAMSKAEAELTRAQAFSAENEWKTVTYKKKKSSRSNKSAIGKKKPPSGGDGPGSGPSGPPGPSGPGGSLPPSRPPSPPAPKTPPRVPTPEPEPKPAPFSFDGDSSSEDEAPVKKEKLVPAVWPQPVKDQAAGLAPGEQVTQSVYLAAHTAALAKRRVGKKTAHAEPNLMDKAIGREMGARHKK